MAVQTKEHVFSLLQEHQHHIRALGVRRLGLFGSFVRSFLIVADERARQFVEQALVEEARLWPDFLLQVSPAYARAATVDELAAQGVLHAETARIFRTPEGHSFHLYQHQIEALEKARHGASYIVTSGTGSGKSLTYFLPIVDTLVRQPVSGWRRWWSIR
jgi:ATP-dependent helicase YprA (DUF1998 family)